MTGTATQPGAGEGEGTKPTRTARAEMFNSIEARRIEEINKDLDVGNAGVQLEFTPTDMTRLSAEDDDDDLTPEERADRDAEIAARRQLEADAAAQAEADAKAKAAKGDIYEFLGEDRLTTTKVKVKVDGQEEEVLVSDLVAQGQKGRAADKRLEEAALAKKAAEKEAAEILAKANAEAEEIRKKAAAAGTDAGGNDKQGSPSDKDAVSKVVSGLYDGDQDQAASALDAAIDAKVERRLAEAKAAGQATVDPETIRTTVRAELTQKDWDGALNEFSANHKRIVDDPFLLGIWQANLNEAGKTSSTPKEAIDAATRMTDEWLGKHGAGGKGAGGNTVTADADALRKREAEKQAAAGRGARSSTSHRAPGTETHAAEPASPRSVLLEMKKQRGQA